MNINELKAGDWVLFNLVPVKIVEVHNTLGELTVADVSTVFNTPVSEVDPIPLNESILKENEFAYEPDTEGGYYWVKWNCLYLDTNKDGSFQYEQKKIDSVHELQHILWALGLNEDLKV